MGNIWLVFKAWLFHTVESVEAIDEATIMLKPRILTFFLSALTAVFLLQGCYTASEQEDPSFQYRPALKPFTSCTDLTDYLLQTLKQEQKLIDYYYALPAVDTREVEAVANNEAAADSVAAASSASISDYTTTNNQVDGVDEGDFIKTVGDYTYILSGGYLVIIDSWPAAQSHELSRLKLEGYPAALFVKGDLVWVVSNLYQDDWQIRPLAINVRSNQLARVSLIDIIDRSSPEVIRETSFEGSYIDARRIGDRIFMATTAHLDLSAYIDVSGELDMKNLLPMFSDRKRVDGEFSETTALISECGDIYRPETANGTGTVTLVSFDLANPQADLSRQTILSNSGLIYANQSHLYIATMEDNFWRWLPVVDSDESQPLPGTTLHKFLLAEKPEYLASGRVDGYLINQFSMDEKDDLLRVVTTTDAWWSDEPPANSLFILEQNGDDLNLRSRLDKLGKPGERIYAARFIGDQGFLVTFEQVDPLYTLDLSDPDNPYVAGELEVPGFSTYLHPVNDDLLLAVGRNPQNRSINLSLFDTSDFSTPVLLHKIEVGQGSYSVAEYDHKAFTWYPAGKMLALPVSRWSKSDTFNGLQLYRVDEVTGFELSGEIDHSSFYQDEIAKDWYYPAGIRRSFFVSDTEQNSYIYSVSPRGMKVNALLDIETDLAQVPLPAYDWGYPVYID